MLRTYREAVCWMATHPGAVLVVNQFFARLIAGHDAEGLSLKAAHALEEGKRARWFSAEVNDKGKRLTLNEDGEMYHRQLVTQRRCACSTTKGAERVH